MAEEGGPSMTPAVAAVNGSSNVTLTTRLQSPPGGAYLLSSSSNSSRTWIAPSDIRTSIRK